MVRVHAWATTAKGSVVQIGLGFGRPQRDKLGMAVVLCAGNVAAPHGHACAHGLSTGEMRYINVGSEEFGSSGVKLCHNTLDLDYSGQKPNHCGHYCAKPQIRDLRKKEG